MTKEQFCWWLHGWMEIEKPNTIGEDQIKEIKKHLELAINPAFYIPIATTTYCSAPNSYRDSLPDITGSSAFLC